MKRLLFFKAIRRLSSSVGRSHKAQEDPKGVWLKCGCVCKKTSPRRLQENMAVVEGEVKEVPQEVII